MPLRSSFWLSLIGAGLLLGACAPRDPANYATMTPAQIANYQQRADQKIAQAKRDLESRPMSEAGGAYDDAAAFVDRAVAPERWGDLTISAIELLLYDLDEIVRDAKRDQELSRLSALQTAPDLARFPALTQRLRWAAAFGAAAPLFQESESRSQERENKLAELTALIAGAADPAAAAPTLAPAPAAALVQVRLMQFRARYAIDAKDVSAMRQVAQDARALGDALSATHWLLANHALRAAGKTMKKSADFTKNPADIAAAAQHYEQLVALLDRTEHGYYYGYAQFEMGYVYKDVYRLQKTDDALKRASRAFNLAQKAFRHGGYPGLAAMADNAWSANLVSRLID